MEGADEAMEIRAQLPVHEVPASVRDRAGGAMIRIAGLVERPGTVGPAQLDALPRVDREEAFTCEEGWSVPGQRWRGIRLGDVLALAGPQPAARFVRVRSGA